MGRTLGVIFLGLISVLILIVFMPSLPKAANAQTAGILKIDGDVATPLTLTDAELLSFPMVSEVARLKCVTGSPDVTYNWTGIPLFYLLTLAQFKPNAYKVITRCSDGYSSDLFVEDALKPTTILALEASGTSLPKLTYGPASPYRLVVPGKYGYKWASGVQEIEVVTTDCKGEWESSGYSDVANVPNYGPMPTPNPPLQTLYLPYGNRTFQVEAFTNTSEIVSTLDPSQKALNLNVTVLQGTSGFTDLILQQDFLSRPYSITLDGDLVNAIEADTDTSSYVYLAFNGGFHVVSILGTEFDHIPEAIIYYPATANVGQNVTFDASGSADVGFMVSYQWSFGDGTNGTGAVVSHSYGKEGTYQVKLNLTNNKGKSSLKTFTITIRNSLGDIVLLVEVILAAMLITLVSILVVLLRKRRVSHPPSRQA
jgi:PKD repeat protein